MQAEGFAFRGLLETQTLLRVFSYGNDPAMRKCSITVHADACLKGWPTFRASSTWTAGFKEAGPSALTMGQWLEGR